MRTIKQQKNEWLAAMRWRRAVEAELSQVGLTFTQWLVLDTLRTLITETGDAMNQAEVAARAELDENTVSLVMRNLEKKHLVSRGIDLTGRAWRIFLHTRVEELLHQATPRVEAASRLE